MTLFRFLSAYPNGRGVRPLYDSFVTVVMSSTHRLDSAVDRILASIPIVGETSGGGVDKNACASRFRPRRKSRLRFLSTGDVLGASGPPQHHSRCRLCGAGSGS